MKAFHNDPTLKADLLEEIKAHRAADQIVQGSYGHEDNGTWRGCAVGCSIHSLNKKRGTTYKTDDHSVYEKEFGIPEQLAHLEDLIFERLPEKDASQWVEDFISAIPVGKDLSLVIPKMMVFILNDCRPHADTQGKAAIDTVISLYQRVISGGMVTQEEWEAARDAAGAAAGAAGYAARAARDAAWAVWAVRDAAGAARDAAYRRYADHLLFLLAE